MKNNRLVLNPDKNPYDGNGDPENNTAEEAGDYEGRFFYNKANRN